MRILLIKTSSLGDLIHTFPAITDLSSEYKQLTLDWVVERSFVEVPKWHPAVSNVIPVDMRKWFKNPLSVSNFYEWRRFVDMLQSYKYDVVIDAQGLIKSALIARKARGPVYGLNWRSAWEPIASLAYDRTVAVDPSKHAIDRMRDLMAGLMDYLPREESLNYGIDVSRLSSDVVLPEQPFLVFFHATTWQSKKWPVPYWRELTQLVASKGYRILLPWGNESERRAAEDIASVSSMAVVPPKSSLTNLAVLMTHAEGVVAVDTGLAHVAAALEVPLVSLYGPTDPSQTGTQGKTATVLQASFACAPCDKAVCVYKGDSAVRPACFQSLSPERVWQNLAPLMKKGVGIDENINHHHDLQPA